MAEARAVSIPCDVKLNDLGQDSMDTAIVQSVVALAKALHMDVTAEGHRDPGPSAPNC